MIPDKKLIFTVTPGRSGSTYLAQLLSLVPDVRAEHEPEPNFVHVMRRAKLQPGLAMNFLREHKLPAISNVPESVYVETGNLTCKGFIEPMILLGLRPGLIFLGRPPREVAWSLLERNCIPGHSSFGILYLLDPRDPYVLPLLGWETLSEYQACFWYALEIERRVLHYTALAAELGMPTAKVANRELNNWSAFSGLLSDLDLPVTDTLREAHAEVSKQYHNPNPSSSMTLPSDDELEAAEEEVWKRIAHYEPLLRQHIERRYSTQE